MATIPGCIPLRFLGQQVLARPLSHDYHYVTISLDALSGRQDDAIDAERNFWDEAQPDLSIRQRGEACDEPGVAAHQLDQTDAGTMARRFHICRTRCVPCGLDRRIEAEDMSIYEISLSMVFGTPTTAISSSRYLFDD